MVQVHRLGWGTKRSADALGCSRITVKRYLAAGGWVVSNSPDAPPATSLIGDIAEILLDPDVIVGVVEIGVTPGT